MKPEKKAYIFLNGDFEQPSGWPSAPADDDIVIAADGGARHALSVGWKLTALVGDMDSLDAESIKGLMQEGVALHQYPKEKDETDFELAIGLALKLGFNNIEVLAALGRRWDMTLGNLMIPEAFQQQAPRIRFRHGAWSFFSLTAPASLSINGRPGDLLSLLPLGGDVDGVSLENCLYPLNNETLQGGYGRGLSNELKSFSARLSIKKGVLMVIHKALEP